MNENIQQFGLGLKYKVRYKDGSSCVFLFVGGEVPLVKIIRDSETINIATLEQVLNNHVSVTEIE